jgi:hypothetical protein
MQRAKERVERKGRNMKGEKSGPPTYTLEETGKCDTWAAVRVIPGRVSGGGTGQP